MFKKNVEESQPETKSTEKPTPAFLRPDYPYQTVGDELMVDQLQPGVIYEIKCPKCEMSIRSQGPNIKATYERLMAGNGCVGCGNKKLIIKRVDLSKATAAPSEKK